MRIDLSAKLRGKNATLASGNSDFPCEKPARRRRVQKRCSGAVFFNEGIQACGLDRSGCPTRHLLFEGDATEGAGSEKVTLSLSLFSGKEKIRESGWPAGANFFLR
jgi:hypothetical protein